MLADTGDSTVFSVVHRVIYERRWFTVEWRTVATADSAILHIIVAPLSPNSVDRIEGDIAKLLMVHITGIVNTYGIRYYGEYGIRYYGEYDME